MVLTDGLEDGTALWLDPMRDVRSVAVGIFVAGGSVDEAPSRLGATHFLEHLLFKRSVRRSGAALGRTIDRLGGDADAYTTKESVAFHARTTSERLDDALGLLLDLTQGPAFTAEDVDVERAVILEEMSEARDVPEDRLQDDLLRALWPDHPLGAPVFGTEASVKGLARAQLADRFREIFRPERTLVVVAGAFEPADLRRRLEKAQRLRRTRGGPSRPLQKNPGRALTRPRARRCAIHIPRPDLSQTHVLAGAPALPHGHRLVPAAWIASTVLGGGVSSRLWRDVRERRGLAYQIGAGLTLHREGGVALVDAATSPANLLRLIRALGRAFRDLRRSGVTAAELRRAKDQVRAEVWLSLESTAARRERAARDWLYRGRPRSADELLASVEAVTISLVDEAVERLWGEGQALGLGVSGPDLAGLTVEGLLQELAA